MRPSVALRHCLVCAATVALFASFAASSYALAAPPPSPTLAFEERREDPRLEKRVTISGVRLRVGELLEKLSEQTGVALTASDDDAAAGVSVAVALQDVPLADAMDALWSLLSYRTAEWEWKREGKPGAFSYRLYQPASARSYGKRLRDQIRADFEHEAKTLLDALKLSPEERNKLKERDPAVGYLDDQETFDCLSAFTDALAEEQQWRVLRGQEEVIRPLTHISDAGRAVADARVARLRKLNPTEIFPAPTQMRFVLEHSPLELTPTFLVMYGNEFAVKGGRSASYESLGGIGGGEMEKSWRRRVRDDWWHIGDHNADIVEANVVAFKKPVTEYSVTERHLTANWLVRTAEAVRLSLLARLPDNDRSYYARVSPSNRPLKLFLDRLADYNVQHKWRNGILLLANANWCWNNAPDHEPPLSVVRMLRQERESDAKGLFSLETLTEMARKLNPDQLKNLADEFPVMENVAQWHPLLALLGRDARLRDRLVAGKGVALSNPAVLAAVRACPGIGSDTAWTGDDAAAYQLFLIQCEDTMEKINIEKITKTIMRRTFDFVIRSRDMKVRAGQGFLQEGKEIESPSPTPSGANVGRQLR